MMRLRLQTTILTKTFPFVHQFYDLVFSGNVPFFLRNLMLRLKNQTFPFKILRDEQCLIILSVNPTDTALECLIPDESNGNTRRLAWRCKKLRILDLLRVFRTEHQIFLRHPRYLPPPPFETTLCIYMSQKNLFAIVDPVWLYITYNYSNPQLSFFPCVSFVHTTTEFFLS